MTIVSRKTVRVLLLNEKNELLLMCIEDFDISTQEGKRNKIFWCTIGGGINNNETIEQAAIREIYEETGISEANIKLGPIVWQGSIDLVLKKIPTCFEESFIVALTNQNFVELKHLTEEERAVVKKLEWFSLENIQETSEVIFPTTLAYHLPDIIARNYPETPITIVL